MLKPLSKLARMWLTRTTKRFSFTNEYDEKLNYLECDNLGLYVHIPFCKKICSFCPYCKTAYQEEKANAYVDALLKEIRLVGERGKRETGEKKQATSLYFGGGTPALLAPRLKEIIMALEEYFVITEGVGVELHPDNVTEDTLKILKEAGVTKISIGVQSFQEKYQNLLGRKPVDAEKMHEALKKVPFETVSMDFIFALPTQTYEDLKADIDLAFEKGANQIGRASCRERVCLSV